MKKISIIFLSFIALISCNKNEQKSDAYGNFEATEITISSESAGKIIMLDLEEGEQLQENQLIGVIDTATLFLTKQQAVAQRDAISSQFIGIIAQVEVYEEQKRVLEKEEKRISELLKDSAATQQQLDEITGQISVIDKQITMAKTQNSSVFSQVEAYDLQIEQLDLQIEKSKIYSPIKGTVLEKYIEKSEMAILGKPLFKIADLSNMKLTVYVDGTQISNIKLNQKVKVLADKNEEEFYEFEGEIIWIASEAEFTPKIIQTKEERVNLVYAVKILVENDGTLKIGMPGEVIF